MHKYRAAARRDAWYDNDDDPPNYNPFRKIQRRHHKLSADCDVESATNRSLTGFASESNALGFQETNRRSQIPHGPSHAGTMPPSSPINRSPVDKLPDAKNETMDHRQMEDSQDIATTKRSGTMAGSADLDLNATGEETRHRKSGFFGRFRKSDEEKDEKKEEKRKGRSASWLKRDKQTFTVVGQLRATILNSWINVLLVFVPIGIAVNYTNVPKVGVFIINFIAIIPLAAMLSYATEEIALRTGETIGGLLNATFGNAVELIVSILALLKNEVDIVQESLIGSILSNLLLVMGMCFFFGGLNRVEQHFNVTVAQTASSLLALAVGSLIIPAAFQAWADGTQATKSSRITQISRGTAILLLVVYGAYLLFQLKTHAAMYNSPSPKVEKRRTKVEGGDATKRIAAVGANVSATMGGAAAQKNPSRDPEEEGEQPQLSKGVALFTLAASTALVAICAEFMVDSINAITETGTVSRTFVGLILLPIVGNAAEHATAVTVACKDKMDLAIGVAVGSSMQIALLVIPFVVVLGWILGNDKMNLAFDGFQIAVLFVAILLVNYLIQDGKSHWLEGVLLQILYLIIAITAWFYPPDNPATLNTK